MIRTDNILRPDRLKQAVEANIAERELEDISRYDYLHDTGLGRFWLKVAVCGHVTCMWKWWKWVAPGIAVSVAGVKVLLWIL